MALNAFIWNFENIWKVGDSHPFFTPAFLPSRIPPIVIAQAISRFPLLSRWHLLLYLTLFDFPLHLVNLFLSQVRDFLQPGNSKSLALCRTPA